MLESLLGNANANWMMQSPKLLQMLGIRDGEKISEEMTKVMQQKQTMDQGLPQQGAGGASPQNQSPQSDPVSQARQQAG